VRSTHGSSRAGRGGGGTFLFRTPPQRPERRERIASLSLETGTGDNIHTYVEQTGKTQVLRLGY